MKSLSPAIPTPDVVAAKLDKMVAAHTNLDLQEKLRCVLIDAVDTKYIKAMRQIVTNAAEGGSVPRSLSFSVHTHHEIREAQACGVFEAGLDVNKLYDSADYRAVIADMIKRLEDEGWTVRHDYGGFTAEVHDTIDTVRDTEASHLASFLARIPNAAAALGEVDAARQDNIRPDVHRALWTGAEAALKNEYRQRMERSRQAIAQGGGDRLKPIRFQISANDIATMAVKSEPWPDELTPMPHPNLAHSMEMEEVMHTLGRELHQQGWQVSTGHMTLPFSQPTPKEGDGGLHPSDAAYLARS